MQTMQPTGVLGESPLPCNGHGQKQRVQARVVKTFAQITAGRQYDAFFVWRYLPKLIYRRAPLPCGLAAP